MFIIGPNASGKSNFLDVFRFLRDIVKRGGGLQKAISDRGGISKIRCLAARRDPDICVDIHFSDSVGGNNTWRYSIGIKQMPRGHRQPIIAYEKVWQGENLVLDRPQQADKDDPLQRTQTHLEQINANQKFRVIAQHLASVSYLHMIPQLLRFPDAFSGYDMPGDPFGGSLLDHIASTTKRTREARLRKLEKALQAAVPQLKHLTHTKDEKGIPHLEASYEHWRQHAAKQREDQFSDGTLRLIGLLWSLLESDSLLLLEEPELSLHSELVAQVPSLLHRLQSKKKRQVILSTHSADLLRDRGIAGEEVMLLEPSSEGTVARVVSDDRELRNLLESGFTIAEAVLPKTAPREAIQLSLSFLE